MQWKKYDLKTIFILFLVGIGVIAIISNFSKTNSQSENTVTTNTNWENFTSEEFNFEVQLPSKPNIEKSSYSISKELGEVTKYEFNSSVDSRTLIVVRVEVLSFTTSISNLQTLKDTTIHGELPDGKGIILSSGTNMFDGYPSIDFVIKNGKNVFIYNKSVFVDNQTYSL